MGYWGISLTGASLQLFGDLNPDGSEMLWGDSPADAIDGGLDKLIIRLRDELGRFPTVEEVDAVKATAPEIVAALDKARKVFEEDVERPATDNEVEAGLRFSDTAISLDEAMRRDIQIGDTVRWAVWRQCGFYNEIDYLVDGRVDGIGEHEKEGLLGTHTVVYYRVVDHNGIVHAVDRPWASKVLPGDESADVVNARRRQREGRD